MNKILLLLSLVVCLFTTSCDETKDEPNKPAPTSIQGIWKGNDASTDYTCVATFSEIAEGQIKNGTILLTKPDGKDTKSYDVLYTYSDGKAILICTELKAEPHSTNAEMKWNGKCFVLTSAELGTYNLYPLTPEQHSNK